MGIKKKIINGLRLISSIFKEDKIIGIPKIQDSTKLLEGKVALITGGSGAIGFAIAEAFVDSGCKVILAGRNVKKLEECCKKIPRNVYYIAFDVCKVSDLSNEIEKGAELFPERRIDILVNSAGVVANSSFMNMTEQEYDRIMNTNAKATFFMSQAMSKFMIKHGIKGHILNVSSSSALRPAWTPYQMSKWTVRGFTLGLADMLLPYGITVNAIAPGPVATEMLGRTAEDSLYLENQPMGRYAHPCEIANLAVFMVSDMGDLIVGDTFYITGGSGTISLNH